MGEGCFERQWADLQGASSAWCAWHVHWAGTRWGMSAR